MTMQSWMETPIKPFGVEVDVKLEWPLPEGFEHRLVELLNAHKVLVFRNQKLSEQGQVHVPENFGRVLYPRRPYINWMQPNRIVGLDKKESDALLQQLFDELYREDRIYRHSWNNGDFVIWDNTDAQHSRCDLTGMCPRKPQRIVIADKSFFDLLPQFTVGDAKISAWGSGGKELVLD